MTTAPAWRDFLETLFPGYLLPEAALHAITAEQAGKFLSALSGRADQLEIVRAAATLAPRREELALFVQELEELVRVLPKRSEIRRRTWRGGFHGRLDVASTSILHSQGQGDSFVTRAQRTSFDLPENLLVRAVAERLLTALTLLRRSDALAASGWSMSLRAAEGSLRRLLLASVLREVSLTAPTVYQQQAALAARHPAYRSAVGWHRYLQEGLDSIEPAVVARIVATGSLEPLKDHTQFELAVLLRLAQTLHAELEAAQPGRWDAQRTLILPDRDDVIVLTRDDGARLRFIYNRAELPSGPCDVGIKHYLASDGRMRPDITVITEPGAGHAARATVFEVKLSDDPSYLANGFQQAMIYRWEYREALSGWPKAVLVIPGVVRGTARPEHEVLAVGWADWISDSVTAGLLRELLS